MTIRKILFLTLALCSIAFAQDKPKIAVYVASSELNDAEKKVLGTKILTPFVQSNQYKAIERSDAFLSNIAKEREKQRDGSVNDSEISRLGKEAGVQFVCVASLENAFGGYSVSARLIDVESAEIVGVGDFDIKSLDDLNEIGNAANEIYRKIDASKHAEQRARDAEMQKKQELAEQRAMDTEEQRRREYTESYIRREKTWDRWKTFGANLLLPGLGSWWFMDDITGLTGSVLLVSGGIFLITLGSASEIDCSFQNDFNDSYEDCNYSAAISVGAVMIAANYTLWNIYRSVFYDKSYAYNSNSGFNLAVLPRRNGNGMAYGMRYSLGF